MSQSGLSGGSTTGATTARPVRALTQKLYGLIELDSAGAVLYARFEGDGAAAFAALHVTGRNFYTEVAPFRNVGEFRQQVESFGKGTEPAHTINFTCDYDDGPLPVRVLLARISERSERDVTKSVLVHIRRPT